MQTHEDIKNLPMKDKLEKILHYYNLGILPSRLFFEVVNSTLHELHTSFSESLHRNVYHDYSMGLTVDMIASYYKIDETDVVNIIRMYKPLSEKRAEVDAQLKKDIKDYILEGYDSPVLSYHCEAIAFSLDVPTDLVKEVVQENGFDSPVFWAEY